MSDSHEAAARILRAHSAGFTPRDSRGSYSLAGVLAHSPVWIVLPLAFSNAFSLRYSPISEEVSLTSSYSSSWKKERWSHCESQVIHSGTEAAMGTEAIRLERENSA